jgi:UDP-N-acetyl-2-amino-2-deoxyglucuronate dehydrogenase
VTDQPHISIAFVGCGEIAHAHWRGIQTHAPQLQITAAVDIDLSRASAMVAKTGGRPFASLEAALAGSDFDVVDIMLPPYLHEEAALLAFAAGKHVVLEKPMSTTLESCDRILDAARKAGTVFMVAEQAQYWPDVVKAQRLIRDGAIGEIVTARAIFSERVEKPSGGKPWRYDAAMTGGGICIDGGLHRIRPLRMWLGEVEEVVATLGYPIELMEGESQAQALLRFSSGVVAAYSAIITYAVDGVGEEFSIIGTDGTIVIEHGREERCLLYNREAPEGRDVLPEGKRRRDAFGLELADFARAVLEGTPLEATAEDSLGELRTVLAMYRSAKSRQWESV